VIRPDLSAVEESTAWPVLYDEKAEWLGWASKESVIRPSPLSSSCPDHRNTTRFDQLDHGLNIECAESTPTQPINTYSRTRSRW